MAPRTLRGPPAIPNNPASFFQHDREGCASAKTAHASPSRSWPPHINPRRVACSAPSHLNTAAGTGTRGRGPWPAPQWPVARRRDAFLSPPPSNPCFSHPLGRVASQEPQGSGTGPQWARLATGHSPSLKPRLLSHLLPQLHHEPAGAEHCRQKIVYQDPPQPLAALARFN